MEMEQQVITVEENGKKQASKISRAAKLLQRFLSNVERTQAKATVTGYRNDVSLFLKSISDDLSQISKESIEDFTSGLSTDQDNLKPATKNRRLASIKTFVEWLVGNGYIKPMITSGIKGYRMPQKLPQSLTMQEGEKLLSKLGVDAETGEELTLAHDGNHTPREASVIGAQIRNRAIAEFLYCTGCRVSEVLTLEVGNIDFDTSTAKLYGKGQKERLVVMSKEAASWIRRYLKQVRPHFASNDSNTNSEQFLFISNRGNKLTRPIISKFLTNAAKQAGIKKHVHPHILRHSFATNMLRSGANIMVIKEFLGHASVATTQVYLTVSDRDKKEAFDKFFIRQSS